MAHGLTIGQLADATGMPPKRIRYYEQVGVLRRADRTASGYRRYGPRDVEHVRFVRRGRSLGLSLEQLRRLTAAFADDRRGTVGPILAGVVGAQLAAIRRQRAELTRLERQLRDVDRRLRQGAAPGANGRCDCLGR
jgi:DNA-binding transcriptional MerR regulator